METKDLLHKQGLQMKTQEIPKSDVISDVIEEEIVEDSNGKRKRQRTDEQKGEGSTHEHKEGEYVQVQGQGTFQYTQLGTFQEEAKLLMDALASSSFIPINQEEQKNQSQNMDEFQHPHMQVPSHPPIYTSTTDSPRFILQEQPNQIQRKSYKNENRWLTPSPLSIRPQDPAPGEKHSKITGGSVTVKLVDENGADLQTQDVPMESSDGQFTQQLDSEHRAQFLLKFPNTSNGANWRLLFIVNFVDEELGNCTDTILSRPFTVTSNIKKKPSASRGLKSDSEHSPDEAPIVDDLKPASGLHNQQTEVWIKGRGFNEKVQVYFDKQPVKVQERHEHLLVVYAPAREDLSEETSVMVEVSNSKKIPAKKKLKYTYVINHQPMHHHVLHHALDTSGGLSGDVHSGLVGVSHDPNVAPTLMPPDAGATLVAPDAGVVMAASMHM